MTDRIWVLGAPDPEMEVIESLLRECGEHVAYAVNERGERVRGGEAYRAHVALSKAPSAIYLVECHVDVDAAIDDIGGTDRVIDVRRIDHHRPGDPGYGRPPEKFLPASSIGQVIATLARLMLPLGWETIAGPSWPWESGTYEMTTVRDRRVWRSDPGVYDTSGEWDWAVSCGAGCWYLVPRDLVIAAAADHCLAHAYAGECPGVDPDALMRWRAETRAAHQGRSVEELLADVEAAREALRRADPISLTARPNCTRCNGSGMYYDAHGYDSASGQPTADGYALCTCGGYEPQWAADLRGQHVPELPEASAREGECFVADGLPGPDGRVKIVCQSGTPEEIEAFMRVWAPAQGLIDIYGDPARGFAGGYLPQLAVS